MSRCWNLSRDFNKSIQAICQTCLRFYSSLSRTLWLTIRMKLWDGFRLWLLAIFQEESWEWDCISKISHLCTALLMLSVWMLLKLCLRFVLSSWIEIASCLKKLILLIINMAGDSSTKRLVWSIKMRLKLKRVTWIRKALKITVQWLNSSSIVWSLLTCAMFPCCNLWLTLWNKFRD